MQPRTWTYPARCGNASLAGGAQSRRACRSRRAQAGPAKHRQCDCGVCLSNTPTALLSSPAPVALVGLSGVLLVTHETREGACMKNRACSKTLNNGFRKSQGRPGGPARKEPRSPGQVLRRSTTSKLRSPKQGNRILSC